MHVNCFYLALDDNMIDIGVTVNENL